MNIPLLSTHLAAHSLLFPLELPVIVVHFTIKLIKVRGYYEHYLRSTLSTSVMFSTSQEIQVFRTFTTLHSDFNHTTTTLKLGAN